MDVWKFILCKHFGDTDAKNSIEIPPQLLRVFSCLLKHLVIGGKNFIWMFVAISATLSSPITTLSLSPDQCNKEKKLLNEKNKKYFWIACFFVGGYWSVCRQQGIFDWPSSNTIAYLNGRLEVHNQSMIWKDGAPVSVKTCSSSRRGRSSCSN